MKITFIRTGGFTGIPLKKTIDTTTIDSEKAQEIEKLLAESHFFTLQNSTEALQGRDRFTYNISIENDSVAHVLDIPEASITPAIQKLIAYLQTL